MSVNGKRRKWKIVNSGFWMVAIYHLLFTPYAVPSAQAVTLDQYGGIVGKPCPQGPKSNFYTAKLGNRWVYCTPEGNAFFMLGVSHADTETAVTNLGKSYEQVIQAKYPGADSFRAEWARQMARRFKSWGFNATGDASSSYFRPPLQPGGVGTVAMSPSINTSFYAFTNLYNLAPAASKSLMDALSGSAYTGWVGRGLPDVYDPNYDAFVDAWFRYIKNDFNLKTAFTSPWIIGQTLDEGDDLFGMTGPGLEPPVAPNGIVHPHIGWIALAVGPTLASSSRWGATYPDTTVHSKAQLRNFLQTRYGTISALNAAWGSNYTTFASAGGWPKRTTGGTGLMDEDGSSAWLGDRDGTLRNATAGVASALDPFLLQFARKYYQIMRDRFKQNAPNMLFISVVMNGHDGLTRKEILQAASEYCDVVGALTYTQALLDKTVQYVGDKPIFAAMLAYPANADSAMFRYPNPYGHTFTTQAERSARYQTQVGFLANATFAATGMKPVVGLAFWELHDHWGEKTNWGLTTLLENAYDGREARAGAQPCSPAVVTASGYVCGGEERDYGDIITGVTQANQALLATIAGESTTTSPCDVNQDSSTNAVDVQLTTNQAFGVTACTADINRDGQCNVIDVQRVVNAAAGGQCVSP